MCYALQTSVLAYIKFLCNIRNKTHDITFKVQNWLSFFLKNRFLRHFNILVSHLVDTIAITTHLIQRSIKLVKT